jgi:predicted DNA-binding transcriptional regulator AlpA
MGKKDEVVSENDHEPLLDSEAVGKILGFSTVTVRRMAERREIPAIAFGTSKRVVWRFSAAAIYRYIEEKSVVCNVREQTRSGPISRSGR